MALKVGMRHWVFEYYQMCTSDDPGLTLVYFTTMSNLVPYAFLWEKGKTMFRDASAWVKAYTAYSHIFRKLF